MLVIDPDQYDGFATPEELNLSPEEVEKLRNQKQELTEYGKEKIRKLMTSPPYIPDDDFIEEYLREPLTPEKKAELQQMRDEWEQARQESLEHKKNNE